MKKILLGLSVSALVALAFVIYSTSARAGDNQNQDSGERNDNHSNSDRPHPNRGDDNGEHNNGIFNPNRELSKSACGDNLGRPVIDVKQKVQNDADSGVAGNYWAFDYYTRNIRVWPVTNWNVEGSYVINVKYLSVDYPETLILTQNGTSITGVTLDTIPHASLFTVTGGSVNGNNINIDAAQGSLVLHMQGAIATDGSMNGTWADEAPGTRTGTWSTITGVAVKVVKNYCAIVTYDGNFYAVPGQVGPGNSPIGALINTPTNAPVSGVMNGGRRATITGALLASPLWPTAGNVGTTNYQCDISGNCPGVIPWTGQYFTAGFTYNDDWWGWRYNGGSHGTWINASTGNSGNIL